ncbi:MAG: hypothetical protein ACR2P0_12470 [Acidimicrobiales bacterium]
MGTRRPAPVLTRRHVLVGAAGTAGAWVTPSVVKLDRVAAATGSCGLAVTRVDWTDFAPTTTMPASVTANDGTVVSLSLTGSTNLLQPGYVGNVRQGQRGGLNDYLALGMSGATNGAGVTLAMSFSRPVQVCFMLLDVDRWRPGWEDSITLRASVGGTAVSISRADIALQGNGVRYVGQNGLRGRRNARNSQSIANADFNAPRPVDRVEFDYFDRTSASSVQVVGVHDLRWC